jgi:hypothetical protein
MANKQELPSRADYREALKTITDFRWSMIDEFTKSETPVHPNLITPGEAANLILPLTFVLPRTWIPGWVRQFAGPEGEALFIKEAIKIMNTPRDP